MRLYELPLDSFTGGYNNVSPDTNLRSNKSPDLLNIEFMQDGAIQKRTGATAILGINKLTGKKIRHLRKFQKRDGTTYNIALTDKGELYTISGSTASLIGTLSTSNDDTWDSVVWWDAQSLSDALIFTNYTDTIKKWDGTILSTLVDTSTPIENPPRAKYMEMYKTMLVLGYTNNGTSRPQRIHFSRLTGDGGGIGDFPAANILEVQTNDGDEITGLKALNDRLLIFKNNSTWALTGTSFSNFYLTQIGRVGTISNGSLQEVRLPTGPAIIFLSSDGWYVTDGGSVYPISNKDFRLTLNTSYYKRIASIYLADKNQYLCAVPEGNNTENSKVYVYDTNIRSWSVWSYSFGQAAFGNLSTGFCISGGDDIYLQNTLYSDNGTAYNAYYKTPYITPNGENKDNDYRRIYLTCRVTGSSKTLGLTLFKDFSDTESTTANFTSANTDGLIWDVGKWDQKKWAGSFTAVERIDFTHKGKYIQVEFRNDNNNEGFRVQRMVLLYKTLGAR